MRAEGVRRGHEERGRFGVGGHGVAPLEGRDTPDRGGSQPPRPLRPRRDDHGVEARPVMLAS